MTTKTMTTKTQPTFEDRFTQLQKIVEQFERGDVPLAESLKLFKQGMALVQGLEAELKETEQTLAVIEQDFTQSATDRVPQPADSDEAV